MFTSIVYPGRGVWLCGAAQRFVSNGPNELQKAQFPIKVSPMLPNGTFAGKTAFVTGGGTGIGKGIATMLSSLGANVVISSRKQDVLEAAVKDIIKATGNQNVRAVAADVRDPDSVKAAVDACQAAFALPNLIVNNAAGNFISPTERLSPRAFGVILDIVLKGTANVTLETGKRLIQANQGGTYLSISTVYAQSGSAFVVPSAAAKAGVEVIIKSLAAEWGRYGIRLNAIAPGPIKTKGAFSRLDPTGQFEQRYIRRIPVGRLGEIGELANLAAYLLSDYANWMSGSVIQFDGGETPSISGEMNALLQDVSADQWDIIEKMIRSVKGS